MGRSGKQKGKTSASSGSTSSGNPNLAGGGIDAQVKGGSTYIDPRPTTVRSSPNTNLLMGASPVGTPGSSSKAHIIPPKIVGASPMNGAYGSVQPKPFPSVKGT